MARALFETWFFIYFFASPDQDTHRKLLALMARYQPKPVSTITIFEIYKLYLEREGKDTAETRTTRIRKEFQLIPVSDAIATRGAQLEHAAKALSKEEVPMADSLIATTSLLSKAVCITDSPHFDKIPQVKHK